MSIRITGHQISLTSAIKRYVTRKLIRLNKKFKHQMNFTCVLEVPLKSSRTFLLTKKENTSESTSFEQKLERELIC